MRRLAFVASLLTAVLCAAPSAQARTHPMAASTPQGNDILMVLEEVQSYLEKDDHAAAYAALDNLTRQAVFENQPPELRHAVWAQMAASARRMRDWPKAKVAIDQAVLLPGANADDWVNRYDLSRYVHNNADTVASLVVLARDFPDQDGRVSDQEFLYWLDPARALPDGENAAFLLAQAMLDHRAPSDPFTDFGRQYMVLVEGLLREGQVNRAVEIARRIDNPDIRIAMRADKRYDALAKTAPEVLDPKAAALARLKAIDVLRESHPRSLSGVWHRVGALLDLNRPEDALAFVDPIIAQAQGDPTSFDDIDTQLAQTIDLKNQALQILGRQGEAVEALGAAARIPERGKPNVNQTLNLAGEQMNGGAYKAALATAATVRPDLLSTFGRSVLLRIVSCSSAQLGDLSAADTALGQLRAMKADGAKQMQLALLCRGDLDSAAALAIARLADPLQRNSALYNLQVTPEPAQLLPLEKIMRERRLALGARPDVKVAVDAVGRIIVYRAEDLWPPKPNAAPSARH